MMKYIDYFINQDFIHDSDDAYKARLLAGICLLYLSLMLFFSLFLLAFSGLPLSAALIGCVLLLALAFVFAVCLYVMYHRGAFQVCAHIAVGATALGILAGVATSGGPIDTPSSMIVVMPAILAFCLTGQKSGLIWSSGIFLVYFVGMMAHLLGLSYPQISPPELEETNRVFNWVLGFVSIVSIVFIYEQMNTRLKEERDIEKNRYKDIATMAVESSVVDESAAEVADTGDVLFNLAMEQEVAIEQLATVTEQIRTTSEQNNLLATNAMDAVKDTEHRVTGSMSDLTKLVAAMNGIQASSQKIQKVNNMIDEIASQTNLLSLNAMIEASRSGESNNGFKVVALEVQSLAERAAKAAKEINGLLGENFSSVSEGVNLSSTMQTQFDEIEDKMQPLTTLISSVFNAGAEQSEGIYQITLGLQDLGRAAEANKLKAELSSQTALRLQENAAALTSMFDGLHSA